MMIRSCVSATEHRERTAAGDARSPVGLSGSVTMTMRTWRPAARAADTRGRELLRVGHPAGTGDEVGHPAGHARLRGVADPAGPGDDDVAADRRDQAEQQGLAARPADHRLGVGGQAAPGPVAGGGFAQRGVTGDGAVATAFPSAAVAFAPALARSLRTHPRLTLVLRQTPAREGLRQVRSGEVDVAIVDDWTSRLAEEIELGGSILTCYHLIRDQLVLVLPRAHRAADPGEPVDLRALRHEPWLAAPAGEPSRQAVDRLLAAVGVAPPVLSEFEGMSTIVSLVTRGIGIAILPRLAVAAAERRVAVRDLPHGLDLARDIHAVARTASVRRPSVAVIVTALRAAAKALPTREPQGTQGPQVTQGLPGR